MPYADYRSRHEWFDRVMLRAKRNPWWRILGRDIPMSDVAQGPAESNAERLARAPKVLEAYAKDIERYGKPLDSGLAPLLRFVSGELGPLIDRSERAEVQLAGCAVAAHDASKEQQAAPGSYGWSATYEDVLALRQERDRLETTLARADAVIAYGRWLFEGRSLPEDTEAQFRESLGRHKERVGKEAQAKAQP